jgi:hypothetical protein
MIQMMAPRDMHCCLYGLQLLRSQEGSAAALVCLVGSFHEQQLNPAGSSLTL